MITPKIVTNNNNSHYILMASGKKTSCASGWMQTLKLELTKFNINLLCFDLIEPFIESHLINQWEVQIEKYSNYKNILIGGKSQGGRVAALVAKKLNLQKAFCIGYPFYTDEIKDNSRTTILIELNLSFKIIQGEFDRYGEKAIIENITFPPNIALSWVPKEGHDLSNSIPHIAEELSFFHKNI